MQALFVVVCITVAALSFARLAHVSSHGGETVPVYSNRRYDPYGTAAFYRLLSQRLGNVRSLERPRLKKNDEGVLVQVLGLSGTDQTIWNLGADVYALPTKDLLAWVAQGNTLIQMTRGRTEVMEELKIPEPPAQDWEEGDSWDLGRNPGATLLSGDDVNRFAEIEEHEQEGGLPDKLPGERVDFWWNWPDKGESEAGGRGVLISPRVFGKDGPTGWRPIAWVAPPFVGAEFSGAESPGAEVSGTEKVPVAGVMPHGRGRVIVVGAPTAALNGELATAENLEFLLELVGDGPVIFDEWAHGVGHAGTVMEVISQFGVAPFLIQVGVLVLVYRWSSAGYHRRDEPSVRRLRSSSEQVGTLGRLYAQALSDSEQLRLVYDEIQRRFARACRCDVGSVRSALDKLSSPAAGRAAALLDEAAGLAATSRPKCPACGYDLARIKGDRCPECGGVIPVRIRRLMHRPELTQDVEGAAGKRWNQRDLARMLTVAHELTQELQLGRNIRQRRTARSGQRPGAAQPAGGPARSAAV